VLALRPNFVEGRTATYEVWTLRETANAFEVRGQQRDTTTRMEITGEMTWTVQRVRADGTATCELVYDWLAIELTGPDGATSSADSRKGKGDVPPLHAIITALSGSPLTFTVTAEGVVEDIKGVEAIRRAIGDQGNPPKEIDFIEAATDLALLAAAPEAAKPGDDWEVPFAWSHEMGTLNHETEYELVSVEEVAGLPLATVTATSELDLELDPEKLPPAGGNGPKVDVKLTDANKVEQILWDLSRHAAVGRNSVLQTTIQVNISFNGNQATRTVTERVQNQALRISEE